MLPHSEAVRAALLTGARTKTKAWVQRQGQTIFGPDDLFLDAPSIDFDEFALSRRVLTTNIPDVDGMLRPRFGTDTFAPYGNELVVQVGVDVGRNTFEYMQMGVFRLLVAQTSTAAMMKVTGFDRSYVVASQSNEEPHIILAGTTLATALGDWLEEKFPGAELISDGTASAEVIGSTLVYESGTNSGNPFQNMVDLARLFGREFFVDAWGRFILRLIPTQTAGPFAASYQPGAMNVAISADVIFDGRGVKNVVKVVAEGSALGESLLASAEVDDPSDPLFAGTGSLVGRLVEIVRTPALTTQEQADVAALATLTQKKGITQNTTLQLAPVLVHEPGDVVQYRSDRESIRGVYALSRWTLRLDMTQPVSIATRVLTPAASELVPVHIARPNSPEPTAATGSASALNATVKVSTHAGAATSAGAGNNAVVGGAGTSATAQAATGSGTANGATPKVKPSAGAATGAGAAQAPAASIKPSAGADTGAGTAGDVTVPHALTVRVVSGTPQRVTGSSGAAAGSFSRTLPAATAAGKLLIARFATDATGTITPPSGWSVAVEEPGTVGIGKVGIYYKENTTGGGTENVVTFTFPGTHLAYLEVEEYDGAPTSGSLDRTGHTEEGNGDANVVVATSLSTTQAGERVFAASLTGGDYSGSGSATASAPFTTDFDSGNGVTAYENLTSAGVTPSCQFNFPTNQFKSAVIATFKAA